MTLLSFLHALGVLRREAFAKPLAPPPAQVALPPAVPVHAVGDPIPAALPPLINEAVMFPIPAAAIPLLHHYEQCQRRRPDGMIVPYRDAAGVPTIGWGNTRWEDNRAVQMTDAAISQERADTLFAFILAEFNRQILAWMPGQYVGTEVHAAFLVFAYNVGETGAENSTAATRMQAGNLNGAAEAMEWWNKSGGKVLKGLQRRRRAEGLVLLGATPESAIAAAEKAFP